MRMINNPTNRRLKRHIFIVFHHIYKFFKYYFYRYNKNKILRYA
jgi:hypothetical protein